MRKPLLLICALMGLFLTSQAQYPSVTIQQIQTVTPADLANCIGVSAYDGDTVTTTGVVVTYPDSNALTDNNSGQIWIRNGFGPFSGLDVIQFFDPSQNGLTSLAPGDSVSITGVITEFGGGDGETEIIPLDNVPISVLSFGAAITPTVISPCDLNNSNQENQLPTGEEIEGSYVELQDVTVTNVTPFSGGTRVSFIVEDATGCAVNISDRYIVQRLPNGNPAGSFVAPNIGDKYDYIRGVVAHSPNGCTGSGGRGYEIHPTRVSDYELNDSLSCPTSSGVTRNHVTPTSSQTVTVTANIEDQDGVSSATLWYAVGASNNTYNQVAMTLGSGTMTNGTWTADIPAQGDGSFVKYYICAEDINMNACCNPDISTNDPLFYTVRDNGTTIYDVQYVPTNFSNATSGYLDMEVTVEGVVVASAESNNLGFVFIQQENQLSWAGIMLTDNPSLATLTMGEKVTVTGTVRENFGFTRIEQVSAIQVNGTGTITPLQLDPSLFTSYSFTDNEPYEGMLVELRNPTPGSIFVVDGNPDAPSNFAEYRLGNDPFDPATGCRVLTGRVTNSAYSSLAVSYVNDPQWETTDGIMTVPVQVVNQGDAFGWVRGIIAYTFGNMKLLPRNNADFSGGVNVDEGLEHRIVAYPNPVSELFRVDYAFNGTQFNATATVTDLMGRTLKVAEMSELEGRLDIDVADLAAGTYILRIASESEGVLKTVKFNKVQ